MDLLILSDSHGHPEAVEEAVRRTHPDALLFAGDGLRDLARADLPLGLPVYAVAGNCDVCLLPLVIGEEILDPEEELLLTLDGVRILLCHGHTLGVKHGLGGAIAHAAARHADVLVFGHTHEPLIRTILPDAPEAVALGLSMPLLLLNPGSAGSRTSPTFGTLTLRRGIPLAGHGTL